MINTNILLLYVCYVVVFLVCSIILLYDRSALFLGIVIILVTVQVELFCVNHLINCSLESTEEFISMEFRFTLRDDGMRAAFQLLHMVLEVM